MRGGSSHAAPARAVRASIAIGVLVTHLAGCFHYVPANHAAMPSGTAVSVGITDRGRVALAERVGPGVVRLSGRVWESTDTSLVLSVTSAEYIDTGASATWTGEHVEVPLEVVSDIRELRLSRSGTALVAGLVVVAAVAASMIALTGAGGGGGERPDPGNGQQQ